jgi:hypothetical protein
MAKNRRKDRKLQNGYQRSFEYSDFEWLVEQFKKQTKLNPYLTLEEFAIGYGIQPNLINRFIIERKGKWEPANEHRRKRKSRTNDLMHFESADFAWLSREFRKQAALTPDLTLKTFAIRHGVQPEWISRFIDTGENTVTLWHGTTEDRARTIMEQGFRRPGKSTVVWFTRSFIYACGVANGRAEARHRMPVVISCEINLEEYSASKSSNFQTYVFPSSIGREVIRSIFVVKNDWFLSNPGAKVTKTAGKLEILSWINWYLKMGNESSINEEHPAVEAIFNWVRAQYAQGREEPISNEEMFSMVTVIRSVPGLEMGAQSPEEEEEDELIDVVITKNAGKLGVLYWINRYLELTGEEALSEDQPAVEAIFKWVETEYAQGRDEPISDEEMLLQVMTHLKQE